jgi:hypothetical protein
VELIQELFLRVMAPRSKILLTSHSRIVVEQMNVFHLKGLSDERIFKFVDDVGVAEYRPYDRDGDDFSILKMLKRISKTMAIMCLGVPLAIKFAAHILDEKHLMNQRFEFDVYEDIWNLHVESKEIMFSLRMSYKELSFPLK